MMICHQSQATIHTLYEEDMQTVKQFIKNLGITTLKNLDGSIVDQDTHEVLDKAIPELIAWINEGLTDIHTTYEILDTLFIHIYESRTMYPLRSKYNLSLKEYLNPPIYSRFIWKGFTEDGEVNAFNDNLAQIVAVYSHEGYRLPMNDASNMFSAFTPQYDVLQLPVNMLSGMVEVVYRANHPEVSYEDNTSISLPPSLYSALANYVAYRVHSTMNGEVAVANATKYLNDYRNVLNNAIKNGVINHNDYQPDFGKFYKRGFV